MKSFENILDLVGGTPLLRLRTGLNDDGPKAFVKLEWYNPTGSVKDRMVAYVVKKAFADGRLKKGDTIIDNTSGNTGSSIGLVASQYGLKAVITTPEKTSQEKVDLIRSYGVEVIVTPDSIDHFDPNGCFAVARRMAKENGWFDLNQYDSQENIEAHYTLTGPEIWNDTEGQITHFVCGIGTGGTFSGAARYLKEMNPNIKTIAVDPEGSIFAEYIRNRLEGEPQPYKIEGIGTDVITKALVPELVDQVITVSDAEAFNRARYIARTEGISAGGSSGAVACAIEQIAADLRPESLIIGIFADAGNRYLSKCYNDQWMKQHGFLPQEEMVK